MDHISDGVLNKVGARGSKKRSKPTGGRPLSVMEAANQLNVSPQQIYDYIAEGKLRPTSQSNPGGPAHSGLLLPIDPDLQAKWNGAEPKKEAPERIEVKPAPAKARKPKVVERILQKPQKVAPDEAAGELRGRIKELENSVSYERDMREKMNREITHLKEQRARLEGELQLAKKLEKALTRYTEKLEEHLEDLRGRKQS